MTGVQPDDPCAAEGAGHVLGLPGADDDVIAPVEQQGVVRVAVVQPVGRLQGGHAPDQRLIRLPVLNQPVVDAARGQAVPDQVRHVRPAHDRQHHREAGIRARREGGQDAAEADARDAHPRRVNVGPGLEPVGPPAGRQ